MNRLEEIQEIINNFIYEKQQMRQKITEIENKRNEIAKQRNEIKFVNGNTNEAFAQNARAKVVELGNRITELGNQSQELQNKLNSRYIEIQKQVNIRIDTLISEGIREIRKIEEQKNELEEKIYLYEARKAKYEVQKQEFLAKFGRVPELSADAVKDLEIQEQENLHNKEIIKPLNDRIENKEQELSELAKYKRAFKNSNWSAILKEESKEENVEEVVENNNINTVLQINNVEDSDDETDDIDALLTAVEEVVTPVDEIQGFDKNVKENAEEETITLPLIEDIEENIKNIENANSVEIVENEENIEVEYIEPLEEIELEEIQPIEEISLEEITPIQEVKIEEIEPIQEVKVEEISEPKEISLEEIQPIEEIKIEDININEAEKEEIKTETINIINNDNEETKEIQEVEQEIIEYEKPLEETREIPTLNEKVALINIIVKIEEKELVYRAQLSNGKEISIYPTKEKSRNLLLKYKENIEEIKEILINYAVAEYRNLDKKVIKKIDPIICEVLTSFAKQYNYDAQSLIYNYAMTFSKYEEYEVENIPNITYNVSYLEGTNLSKKEKEILSKICKSAKKNEKIDIIGCNTGFSKIRYILKRTFNTNNENALPEGKY